MHIRFATIIASALLQLSPAQAKSLPARSIDGANFEAARRSPGGSLIQYSGSEASTVPGENSVQHLQFVRTSDDLEKVRAALATIIESRTNAYDASRIKSLEPATLRAAGRQANRTGDRLTLQFVNGTSRTFINKGDCEDLEGECHQYTLLAVVGSANFFLVQELFYEHGGCLIVDMRSGRETEIPDVPYVSPSGERLLIVSGGDGGGGYWPLQIWRRRGDIAFVEWKQDQTQSKSSANVSKLQWDNDSEITLKMMSESPAEPAPPGFKLKQWSIRLNLTNQGWSLSASKP